MGLSSSSLESTFLNLLVTELQNQDPTQPVDPTAMVGQMVSLNQLDQLISINQTLSGMSTGSSTAGSTSPTGQATQQAATNAASTAPATTPATTPARALASDQLPATSTSTPGNNTGLMNLYGSYVSPNSTTKSMYSGVR
jgi:flagellar basal-body rod modification protein FlgD